MREIQMLFMNRFSHQPFLYERVFSTPVLRKYSSKHLLVLHFCQYFRGEVKAEIGETSNATCPPQTVLKRHQKMKKLTTPHRATKTGILVHQIEIYVYYPEPSFLTNQL